MVLDQKAILGENYLASYLIFSASAASSLATTSAHLLQIMAGASLNVRIRRIEIGLAGLATTGSLANITLLRLTSAGTGGTALTPAKLDLSDAGAGATAMVLPSAKGAESTPLLFALPYILQTVPASGEYSQPIVTWDFDRPRSKPLIIPAGAANGVAVKIGAGIAGAAVTFNVWLDETSF